MNQFLDSKRLGNLPSLKPRNNPFNVHLKKLQHSNNQLRNNQNNKPTIMISTNSSKRTSHINVNISVDLHLNPNTSPLRSGNHLGPKGVDEGHTATLYQLPPALIEADPRKYPFVRGEYSNNAELMMTH